MKLILVRHGETEENLAGILQGHTPGTLSLSGVEQGKKLAQRLKGEKIDAIYSSDLKRASDTTKIILLHHPEAKLEYCENLREGNGGSWTGKPTKDLDWNNRPADAETQNKMKERAQHFIDKIVSEHPKDTVLVVGHAGFNRVMISRIINSEDPFKDMSDQRNTAVNIFEIYEDKTHKVHCLNCTNHLK